MYRSIGWSTGKKKISKMLNLLPWHGKMNKRNLLQAMGELGPANTLPLLFNLSLHSDVLCLPPAPFPVYKGWLPSAVRA